MKTSIFAMLLVAATGSLTIADTPVTVSQKGLKFGVEELKIHKGQTVVFMNDDRTSHNITVAGEGNNVNVNGGLQAPGGEFRMPFSKPGVHAVSCGIHPKMKMTVVVE